jgi:DHA1 family inner membrane transport protein
VVGALTAGWSLRTRLLVALAVFALGNALTALAPGYPLVLASRVVAAVGAALFTATATATAATLAGPAHRGRAIAIVMLGMTSSLVLGTPIGTVLGSALGWRATLWFVTALGGAAALVIAVTMRGVRDGAATAGEGIRRRLAPLADRRVLAALGRTFVVFTGVYLLTPTARQAPVQDRVTSRAAASSIRCPFVVTYPRSPTRWCNPGGRWRCWP